MKILFVHQNFPGQYLQLVRHLAAMPGNEIVFITQREDRQMRGVRKIVYKPAREVAPGIHRYLRDTEAAVLNAQAVARVALDLRSRGFVPDVMLGHNGWGETWYLKDVFKTTPLIGYFEFFYRFEGADVGFEPGPPLPFDDAARVRTKNIGNLLALDAVDIGQCPTEWQRSLYPEVHRPRLHVVHEGIDTDVCRPNPDATVSIPGGGLLLTPRDEVITFVARNLEPYRGFPSFMRSLPAILAERPNAQVLIVGGDGTSYGPRPADGLSYREKMLEELHGQLDLSRVHFLGKVPYPVFLSVLQVSSVHVYLTYPFVLSWSLLEAMSCGCTVVGSRTPPVEEVISHGENGWLVDMFSIDAIARQVLEVLASQESQTPIRANARRHLVENYDLRTRCLPRQVELIESAMGRSGEGDRTA